MSEKKNLLLHNMKINWAITRRWDSLAGSAAGWQDTLQPGEIL